MKILNQAEIHCKRYRRWKSLRRIWRSPLTTTATGWLHSALGYRTPEDAEQDTDALQRL